MPRRKVDSLGAEGEHAFNRITDLWGGSCPLLTVGKFRKKKSMQVVFNKEVKHDVLNPLEVSLGGLVAGARLRMNESRDLQGWNLSSLHH